MRVAKAAAVVVMTVEDDNALDNRDSRFRGRTRLNRFLRLHLHKFRYWCV